MFMLLLDRVEQGRRFPDIPAVFTTKKYDTVSAAKLEWVR